MPTIPTLSPVPDLPSFRWNARSRRYIDRRGRFVSREAVRSALDGVVKGSADVMAGLSEQLRAGNISLAEWQTAMMVEIKTTQLAGAAMAAGGWDQMTQADFGRVGQIIGGIRAAPRFW